ncbi:TetR/AcrR family transcriptional regulator C-terminal domain-containing protein [Streptomyces sp. NPDC088812]|uniref:TetR/AcrR family transcriptional regulator C-terminal domain-containing protein n=1 Tax=Streptomyces sp. NPDC088812 TaxID=3365905 RepID=UPI0038057790
MRRIACVCCSFTTHFSAVDIARHSAWQDACRAYARGFTDSAVAAGVLADRIRLSDPYVTKVLEPTEAVLEVMVRAGFDDEHAMRVLSLLANICLGYARDVATAARSGVTPRPYILRKALDRRDAADFETLARIADLPVTTYDERQFELSVDLFISGAEALLRDLTRDRD